MVDLGTLAGDFSYGTFINANNHIVGYSTINVDNDRVHAFLHDGSTMIDLGSLGGASMESDRSFALGVNQADQVVVTVISRPEKPWAAFPLRFNRSRSFIATG
jgi:probable HAF family extracellular repeat protein